MPVTPPCARRGAGRSRDPHRVAAERRGQELTRGIGDEVRAGQPRQPLADPVRAERAAPATASTGTVSTMIARRGEPREARLGEDVERRPEVDLPHKVGDGAGREDERPDDADSTIHAPHPRTSRVRSSNATFAAATAVGWPGPSYGGLTSTTS